MKRNLFFTLVLWMISVVVFGKPQAKSLCFASFTHDTLTIGNNLVKFYYVIKNGQLCMAGHQYEKKAITWYRSPQPDLKYTAQQSGGSDFQFTQHTNSNGVNEPDYLEATISWHIADLSIKRVWRIHPDIPAIGSQYWFKGKASDWFTPTGGTTRNEMIENPALLSGAPSAGVQSAFFPLDLPHWQATIVKLTDATDYNNNLAEQQNILPYARPLYRKGNLLLLYNPINQTRVFILKQAPLQESQQSYPGFDFVIDKKQILVAGLGLSANDISPDFWQQGYSVVLGVTGNNELDQLTALRRYQQAMRPLKADRDELIMGNTWGDRSQDSRMNEAFILKELDACARMGIDHFQLDDGWQQGISKNSSTKAGKKWNDWQITDWQPNITRFPSGLKVIADRARALHIGLGLWFNPSSTNHYALWERDAKILTGLYDQYGIQIFKIDGLDLADKESEINVRKFFDHIVAYTKGKVVFNLDVTAGRRGGYFFFNEYGNIFLENRYTDWANYYPHLALRNLWQLSKYVPAERIQLEWLNSFRNADKYSAADPLAPAGIPWDYQLATTLMAQPLAWMEVSNLPEKAFATGQVLQKYKQIRHDLHTGTILPIGNMPDGYSWTGFQSIHHDYGYFLIFRENTETAVGKIITWLKPGQKALLTPILGAGKSGTVIADGEGKVQFGLPGKLSFALYRYNLIK